MNNHLEKRKEFTLPDFIGKMTIEELDNFLAQRHAEFRKLHPHADRNKALTGNPYYKLDGEKIFCLDCGQRKGNMIDPCPICGHQTPYVYESMLNNPIDPRWQRSTYRKAAITDQQQIALDALKERMMKINLKDGDL